MNCHSNIIGVGWSDERIEALKHCWAKGLSGGKIARELGGVTRSGVLGKLHRLGLMGRYKRPSRAKKKTSSGNGEVRRRAEITMTRAETAAERVQHVAEREVAAKERRATLASETVPPLTTEEREQAVTLMGLTPRTCRWPLGDPASPDFLFCGALPAPDCPYCARHARLAYQPRTKEAV